MAEKTERTSGTYDSDWDISIGCTIQNFRDVGDIDQKELAEYLHLSQAELEEIETGKASAKPGVLARVAHRFGIKPSKLTQLAQKNVPPYIHLQSKNPGLN